MKMYFLFCVSLIMGAAVLSERLGVPGGYAFLFGVAAGALGLLAGVILHGYLEGKRQ